MSWDDIDGRLAAILGCVGDGILITDRDGRVRFLNRAAELLTGWGLAQARGQPLPDVAVLVDEESRRPVDIPAPGPEGCASLGANLALLPREGTARPVDGTVAFPRDAEGAAVGMVVTVREAAESRRAAEALRDSQARKAAILDTALDAVITVDQDGTILEFNPAAERLFGYHRQDAVGRDLGELIVPPVLHTAGPRGMARFLVEGEGQLPRKRFELPARHADGSEFPAELAITQVSLPGPPLFTAYVQDISERKQADRQVAAQYALARALGSASSLEQAAPQILEAVGQQFGWDVGLLWCVDRDRNVLHPTASWHRPGLPFPELQGASRGAALAPGEGLPGRVWEEGQAGWLNDAARDPRSAPAAAAGRAGLHGAVAFPLTLRDRVLGVMEFLSRKARPPDAGQLQFLTAVADQVGQFLERKRSEALLRQSEEHTRLLLESTGEGIYGIDADGLCTFANPACARLLGYADPREFIGKDMHGLIHHTRADGTPLPAEECRVYRAFQAGGGTQADDEVFWRADGTSFPVEYRSYPIVRGGRRVGAVVSFVDITRRRRDEEAMRLRERALREVAQGIFITDPKRPDDPITYINAGFERITGYPSAVVKGQYLDFLCGPDTDAGALQALHAALDRGREYQGEVRLYRRDGTPFWCTLTVTPLRDAGGRVTHFVGLLTDISERKLGEEALRQAKEGAEEASQAKSQFLANMSHELRTPLNAVILYSELLQEEATDRGVADMIPDLEKIRAAGKHLLALVNGVLDLSKIEAGKMELYLETFDVPAVVREVAATVEPLAQKKDNVLEVRCQPDLGPMRADLTKLRQVLFNLLSNACKFTERGKVTLDVARGPDGFRFRVRDTGIGMTAEQAGKLFQPFTQADASTTRKYGGTGLGLVIAKRFCEMMGGGIGFTSEPGKGTTFTLRLPAQVAPAAGQPEAPRAEETPEPAGAPAGAGTVLVIDDEAPARENMARFLAAEGFRPLTAPDGAAGLRLARQVHPDIILLDVIMPQMDGWSVLQELKADPLLANIPVVLLTMVQAKDLGYLLGAAEYLTKPVDRERLLAVLHKYRPESPPRPVLIVEDDDGTRQVLRRSLTKEGWAVDEAPNGRVALQRVAAARPELILLDLMMPEMDGFEFLEELRRHEAWRGIPVVILTSKDLTPEERLRLSGSVERVLQKGAYSREALLREVRRLVASHTAGKRREEPPVPPAPPALPQGR